MSTTYNLTSDVTLFHADMREALRVLPDNSIDSVCCDPPYHLTSIVKRFGSPDAAPAKSEGATGVYARSSAGFMGRVWDGGDIAFQVDTWREVLRVLKPGGFCAAFGAPRNFGRLQCAMLDAGFDERDTILNMLDPADPICQFIESLNESQLDAFVRCLGNNELASAGFLAWNFGVGFPKGRNVAKDIDALLLRGSARTEDVRRLAMGDDYEPSGRGRANYDHGGGSDMNGVVAPYDPVTEQAKAWQSWNVALKPAFEPIVLARKPLSEGTVAANVLRWRTGALNIGGCRVPSETREAKAGGMARKANPVYGAFAGVEEISGTTTEGRWPANLVTDGSAEVVEAFPTTASPRIGNPNERTKGKAGMFRAGNGVADYRDQGSAARFFFNSQESDTQWLARNLPSAHANNAAECSSLQSEHAVSVLASAVAQSTPLSELICTACPERFTDVTPSELRRISEAVTETILSFGEKCSPESRPERLSRSNSLVEFAVIRDRTDTITITISRLKSSGFAEPVTFRGTLPNSERGARDCASRFHYSAKASKADRAGSKHPTVKPIALIQWLQRLITPPGGVTLDPFAGSGTAGVAAAREGFRCILVEREAEYVADIIGRFQSPSLVPTL